MKTLFFILALGLFSPSGDQEKYFPDAYRNVYIGMPMDSLLALKGNVFSSTLSMNGSQLVETPARDTVVSQVLYLFDKDSLVYEVIIEYKEHFNLSLYMAKLYGPVNTEDEEWLFTLPEGRELHIWQYQNRLCIANGSIYK